VRTLVEEDVRWLCAFLVLGLISCANPRAATVDDALGKLLAREKIPGAHYLVVDDEGPVHEARLGLRDTLSREAPREDDLWMVASATKAVTAIAVLQLVERGRIQLDDPLSRHLPEHPYGDALTVRQLLTHTAGVPNPAPLQWFYVEGERFDRPAKLAELLKAHPKLDHTPGERWGYSNLGFWLLEALIERVTGEDYADFVRRSVFQPLGISDEDVRFDRVPEARAVRGHSSRWSATNLVFFTLSSSRFWVDASGGFSRHARVRHWGRAYGGLSCTARALGALLSDLLRDAPRVLSRESVDTLFEQQLAGGRPLDHALGWVVGDVDGTPYRGKQGGALGFFANIRVYPKARRATIFLANRTAVTPGPIDAVSDALDALALEGP
jgi:CubicO group peptidase (beta-lactamase class C family)